MCSKNVLLESTYLQAYYCWHNLFDKRPRHSSLFHTGVFTKTLNKVLHHNKYVPLTVRRMVPYCSNRSAFLIPCSCSTLIVKIRISSNIICSSGCKVNELANFTPHVCQWWKYWISENHVTPICPLSTVADNLCPGLVRDNTNTKRYEIIYISYSFNKSLIELKFSGLQVYI